MSAHVETTEIRDGIEWFVVKFDDGREETDCQCARCGSSCAFLDCWQCGGEGEVERDSWDGCGEGYWARCDACHGKCGWWCCVSGREWCEAHPLPGREATKTTALDAQAWLDAQ